jgi:NADPH:quinone reductase-like Zn-dependent oxidoreductase
MKAIVFTKKAHPDKLVCRDIEKPIPDDNEVLVNIQAVSINAEYYCLLKMG